MAILTALLSAMSRKLGSLIQAIRGWSVAALFGQLSPPKWPMISIAMTLSVLWPSFVVGMRTVLNGYPLALGFALSFVVTVITVPTIKIASAARRRSDQHPSVQAKPGRYEPSIDLLLRGDEHKLASVRATLGNALLERDAWVVAGPRAQHLQNEFGRLWEALQRHEVPDDTVEGLTSRIKHRCRGDQTRHHLRGLGHGRSNFTAY